VGKKTAVDITFRQLPPKIARNDHFENGILEFENQVLPLGFVWDL
jgi:hypothetical protein